MKIFSGKKDGISLKLFVAIVIIVMCCASIGIYALISQKICYKQYKENIIEDVYKHTELIEKHLSNDETDLIKLSSDVELLAAVYGGRIFVIDENYKIQKDSYGLRDGDYIVSKNIIDATVCQCPCNSNCTHCIQPVRILHAFTFYRTWHN